MLLFMWKLIVWFALLVFTYLKLDSDSSAARKICDSVEGSKKYWIMNEPPCLDDNYTVSFYAKSVASLGK